MNESGIPVSNSHFLPYLTLLTKVFQILESHSRSWEGGGVPLAEIF